MRRIGITPEHSVFRERERIINFLNSGYVDLFHIRKPSFTENQMREYLSFFPINTRQRLALHDWHSLAKELEIGGVHFNNRNGFSSDLIKGKRVSFSCHSIEQVNLWKDKADYLFLSPIFNSISKQGYKSNFALKDLQQLFKENILDNKVVALGGVTEENINKLEEIGFSSCAILGSLWQLPKTMFISPNKDIEHIIEDCEEVLQYGIKFIQIRMKEASNDDVVKVANHLRPLCDKHCALLTVDDRIDLLSSNLFDGVHLGKNDMPIKEAKKITSNRFLLGATCNTIEDVFKAIEDGADYLGIGPYRYTTTKKNLSPILGLEGYNKIIQQLNNQNKNIPFYAIGGITINDLSDLKHIGVYGVALSGTVSNSVNKQQTIKTIIKTF